MSETEAQLVNKIASRESALIEIYRFVYPVLKKKVDNLDLPDTIQPAKAAAILKAILGSTTEDKLQGFEGGFSLKMPDGQSLPGFVRKQLDQIGIGYHDFYPYLLERGWMKSAPAPPR